MSVRSGRHELGPDDATLSVRTERTGAAAKAGHDLLIHVTSWRGKLTIGEEGSETSAELVADSTSLKVIEGTGGIQPLGEEDKANIEQTIDQEVLEGKEIEFRSTRAEPDSGGERIDLEGELTIGQSTEPISFGLAVGEDGAISAGAVIKQTDWGIKPYSGLFGALKLRDEVEVALEGHLPDQPQSR
jgi:polyisoprenoid-binding protein YceI